jgi:integrase
VAEVVDDYLARGLVGMNRETVRTRRRILTRFRKDHGCRAAASLTPGTVEAWVNGQATWGRSQRWLAGGIVHTMIRWAVRERGLSGDPLVGLSLPSPRSRGTEALVCPADHERLLAAAPEAIRDALSALHATGCRPGELVRVEARHFDPTAGAWVLGEHKTDKTGKPRVVLLPPGLVELCRELARRYPTGPLFRNSLGRPLTTKRIRDWVYDARRRLGLGRVVPYGYRHTFATDALAGGVPDAQVAELLGHSGTGMLHRHYSHLTAKAATLRSALGRVR